jgi:DNA-binding MarR family transcriptional regulator
MTTATPKKLTLREGTPGLLPIPALMEVVHEAFFREFREELVEAGYAEIRPTHGCVFRFLHDEGLRLTNLAGLANMTKQSVGEIVDNLVELGYVERIPDPDDKRAKLIRLTAKGEQAQGVGLEIFTRIEARWAERFGAERMDGMRVLLEDIANVKAPQAVPELAKPALADVA